MPRGLPGGGMGGFGIDWYINSPSERQISRVVSRDF